MKKNLVVILAFAVLYFVYFNYEGQTGQVEDSAFEAVIITKVVDGDTVYSDKGEKIRIIGINAPEVGEELLSEESMDFAKKHLLNKEVYIEKDVEVLDQYDRILAYIWIDKPENLSYESIKNLNYSAMSLSVGLSRTYTFEPNVKYERDFKRAQREARDLEIGMWEVSEEGTTRGNELR
ncbi:MAG: thermonuclease family protein [Peptoniphilus sp.]|nr:thermonuclease family protein [Peptoniphilus sp.]